MALYELEGIVKIVLDQQTFPSGFTKREFVVTSEEKFPQEIKFECVKDRCELLADLKVGDRVKVSFNIRGNEYKERYYVNLSAWKVDKLGGAQAEDSGADAAEVAAMNQRADEVDPEDNIPF